MFAFAANRDLAVVYREQPLPPIPPNPKSYIC